MRTGGAALLLATLSGCLCDAAWAADKKPRAYRQPGPYLNLKFDAMGVAMPSKLMRESGSSLLTVHFIDDTHLLVTSSLRKLIPRLVGDSVNDDDRLVGARIVALPSGKTVAETEWHMHDHGRYLWALGHGRFLVRIGESLSIMSPLTNLTTRDPLQRVSFAGRPAGPEAVLVSEDGRIMTVETPLRMRRKKLDGDAQEDKGKRVTLLDFYRLAGTDAPGSFIEPEHLGSVTVPQPLVVPADGAGYLSVHEGANNRWAMRFEPFSGKALDLGQVDSTCTPRLEMVSPGEFIAMTCRGADDHVRMVSYGLDGKETWEEQLGDFGAPVFAHAAAAGRFAVSNVAQAALSVPGSGQVQTMMSDMQEVRVYQIASGDLLLRVPCTPVFKTAENFDLSADGQQVVIVKEDGLALYRLAAPARGDLEDMAEVAKFSPPAWTGKIDAKRMVRAVVDVERGPEDVVAPELAVAPMAAPPIVVSSPAATTATTAAEKTAEPRVIANGDDQTERTGPPTLFAPGEDAEGAKTVAKPK